MLTYHPIHDPSHCTFRLLCLMSDIKQDEVSWDFLKILDFYVLFPHLIASMKFSKEILEFRPMLKQVPQPYESLPSPARLMFELGEIQEQTIKSMIAKGIAEKDSFVSGKIKIRFAVLPKMIRELIAAENFRQEDWYQFLTETLVQLPLKGPNGIKDRTGLMEYRYDAA